MSGLSRTPGKRVWANPHRGFESRPLRQNTRLYEVSKKVFFLTHQLTSQKQKCWKSPLTSGLFLFSPSKRGLRPPASYRHAALISTFLEPQMEPEVEPRMPSPPSLAHRRSKLSLDYLQGV